MKVIFAYKPYSLFSLAIKLVTFSRWSHVAVMLSEDEVIDSTFLHGVAVNSTSKFLSNYKRHSIVDVKVKDEQAAIKFALQQVGKPYDWTALLGLVLQRNWQRADSWFCSELLEAILYAGGTPRVRQDYVSTITPQMSWTIL